MQKEGGIIIKLFTKIITSILALAIIATTSVTAFAATAPTSSETNSPKTAFAAKRLALTEEQKSEMMARAKERLNQQLADGKITQEQYDAALADIESGQVRGLGGVMGQSKRPEMTEEQKAEMMAKAKEKLNQHLADGKITQEQYDAALDNIESGEVRGLRRGMGSPKKAN